MGIQTSLETNVNNVNNKTNQEVSFMIFRTGSVLIVGKCEEELLHTIYQYLKIILNNEYKEICQKNIRNINDEDDVVVVKDKKKKIRKKNIIVTNPV